MKTIFTNNVSQKGAFNAKNSALSLQEAGEIEVSGVMLCIDEEEDKEVGFLIATDGTAYSTISETAIRGMKDLEDWDLSKEPLTVEVATRKSKAGRDFLTLAIK